MVPGLYDVGGPGLLAVIYGAGLAVLCLVTLVVILVEAGVLALLKWRPFGRSLLASLVMNLVSTLVGFLPGVIYSLNQQPGMGFMLLWLFAAWALSVVIEGLILSAFNREAGRQNWLAALLTNLVSYLLILGPLGFFGILGLLQ